MKRILLVLLLTVALLFSGIAGAATNPLSAEAQAEKVPVIVKLKSWSDRGAVSKWIKEHEGEIKRSFRLRPAFAAWLSPQAVDRLKKLPGVSVVPDLPVYLVVDETYDWGAALIDADLALRTSVIVK